MEKYKTLKNLRDINIDFYLTSTDDCKYIIAIPERLKDNSEMVVQSFNSSGNPKDNYDQEVQAAMDRNGIETTLLDAITDFPVMMPIVPNIEGFPDFQQLSLESVRDFGIHEKAYKCIEDARRKIKELTGKDIQEKVFLNGYSSSGVFAERFALIYPEIVSRCLIGGEAGTIPVPTPEIKYPIGIEDYEELVGKPFNMEAYKEIMFGYYVGELEEKDKTSYLISLDNNLVTLGAMHDMSYRVESVKEEVGALQRSIYGVSLNDRFKNSIQARKDLEINTEGIIIEGADHRDIFDRKRTPNTPYLVEQLLRFYDNNIQLNPNGKGCCQNIDSRYQEERNRNAFERKPEM